MNDVFNRTLRVGDVFVSAKMILLQFTKNQKLRVGYITKLNPTTFNYLEWTYDRHDGYGRLPKLKGEERRMNYSPDKVMMLSPYLLPPAMRQDIGGLDVKYQVHRAMMGLVTSVIPVEDGR